MFWIKSAQKIIKSQQGISLVMVIVAISLFSAGTLYVIDLNKEAKVKFGESRAMSFGELERRRIAAVLGDKNTCMAANNFGSSGTKQAVRADITALYTKDGTSVFLTKTPPNNKYYNGALKVTNIRTELLTDPTLIAKRGVAGSNKYELVVTYQAFNLSGVKNNATTQQRAVVIRVPMYMKVDGSNNVLDCYALGSNTNMDTLIGAACSPITANANKTSYTTATSAASVSDCNHNATFATTATYSQCPTVGATATQQGFTGFTLTTNTLNFPTAGYCSTVMGSAGTCATDAAGYNISNSGIVCSYPGGTRDGACSPGQILWHTSGSTSVCVSVSCPAFNFVQKVDNTGTTCFIAPTTTCPANQYVYQFNPNGTDQCAILPVFTGSCAASYFGVSITRATATSGGTLNCAYYNKAKSCPSPSATTFVTSVSATGAAVCSTY